MNFRQVTQADLEQIAYLYKVCFNFDMSVERYNYWYLTSEGYCSMVCEIDNRIVGHNAFIPRQYHINGKKALVALSAGGMVDAAAVKTPGLFLRMLQHSVKEFKGDAVIAFPNKKAEPFWTKILKFDTLVENYYSITPETLNRNFSGKQDFLFKRDDAFISVRTEKHPRYAYEKMVVGDLEMIIKEYAGNIELVYLNKINANLIKGLEQIFEKGYRQVNVISIYGDVLKEVGFQQGQHNVFVCKWLNEQFQGTQFECQMIDSDVF